MGVSKEAKQRKMKKLLSVPFLMVALGFFAFRLATFRQVNAQSEGPISQIPSVPGVETGKFAPQQVVPPFQPITEAPLMLADEVSEEVLDSELVLGLTLNGESRAYPINMLTGPSREIINDTIGGIPIAATW